MTACELAWSAETKRRRGRVVGGRACPLHGARVFQLVVGGKGPQGDHHSGGAVLNPRGELEDEALPGVGPRDQNQVELPLQRNVEGQELGGGLERGILNPHEGFQVALEL